MRFPPTVALAGLLAWLLIAPAVAQPADCPTEPGPVADVPLTLQLQGLPGVPRGLTGYLDADVPAAPPGGTLCRADPPPQSADVLAGPPGDVLRGPPVHDLLRGPVPRVSVVAPEALLRQR